MKTIERMLKPHISQALQHCRLYYQNKSGGVHLLCLFNLCLLLYVLLLLLWIYKCFVHIHLFFAMTINMLLVNWQGAI